ncbi:hypothetical protein ACET3Z_013273 [Daucus carota]
MADRYANPNFYVMDMDDEDDSLEVPAIKIKKLRDLNEIFIQDISKAPISNVNSPAIEKSTNKSKSRMPTEMIEPTITNADLKELAVTKDNTEMFHVSIVVADYTGELKAVLRDR